METQAKSQELSNEIKIRATRCLGSARLWANLKIPVVIDWNIHDWNSLSGMNFLNKSAPSNRWDYVW